MKRRIEFHFINLTSKYTWIKEWYTNDLQTTIVNYLKQKKLPFEELTESDVKWREL